MYDVFFISYDEPRAEFAYSRLKAFCPTARHVRGIKGIHAAHARCAELCRTRHFFVIDADNRLLDETVLSYRVPDYDSEYVHLWYARNPLNNLTYGWGGLKLFPKQSFTAIMPGLDMTTTFSLKIIPDVVSVTEFNASPFETWRSAFRETVKLARSDDPDAPERLRTWCEEARGDFAEECLRGAREGRDHVGDPMLINDYDWLRDRFDSGLL